MKNHFEPPKRGRRLFRLIVALATVLCAVDPFDLPALAVEILRPTLRHEGSRMQASPLLVQASVVNPKPMDLDDDDDLVLEKDGRAEHIPSNGYGMMLARSKTADSIYSMLARGPPQRVGEHTADHSRHPYSSQRKLFAQLSKYLNVQYQNSQCRWGFARLHSL